MKGKYISSPTHSLLQSARIGRRDCFALGMVGALGFSGALRAASSRPPNIVFILADDLGYADLGSYGLRDSVTPHLDRLASQDIRLTQGYANSPVCSPTRVALLTGQHQDRFAVGLEEPLEADKPVALPLETPTLPGILRQAGYRTSLIGKWHVGIGGGVGPRDYGYDSFFGFLGGMTDYFSYAQQSSESVIQDNGRNVVSGKYLTQLLGERAALEIAENRNSASPFFLSLHFSAPHSPWQGPTDSELAKPNSEWALMDLDGGNVATYRSMVGALDSAVGQVLAAIESMGEADNTIVIFTSDNGGARFSDNWPLIGVKSELMEGGIRVPIIVRWPVMIQQD